MGLRINESGQSTVGNTAAADSVRVLQLELVGHDRRSIVGLFVRGPSNR